MCTPYRRFAWLYTTYSTVFHLTDADILDIIGWLLGLVNFFCQDTRDCQDATLTLSVVAEQNFFFSAILFGLSHTQAPFHIAIRALKSQEERLKMRTWWYDGGSLRPGRLEKRLHYVRVYHIVIAIANFGSIGVLVLVQIQVVLGLVKKFSPMVLILRTPYTR